MRILSFLICIFTVNSTAFASQQSGWLCLKEKSAGSAISTFSLNIDWSDLSLRNSSDIYTVVAVEMNNSDTIWPQLMNPLINFGDTQIPRQFSISDFSSYPLELRLARFDADDWGKFQTNCLNDRVCSIDPFFGHDYVTGYRKVLSPGDLKEDSIFRCQ
ncbi:hypothetical protein [Aquisalinus flavus]|nr:hypothetical protein [Aquisalinus flavus]MBD0425187.1 hypothetical protein [Aquisalinus flavus]UNE49149.1 hypothetical protein FF099_14365 [Aquisalinus flavus]